MQMYRKIRASLEVVTESGSYFSCSFFNVGRVMCNWCCGFISFLVSLTLSVSASKSVFIFIALNWERVFCPLWCSTFLLCNTAGSWTKELSIKVKTMKLLEENLKKVVFSRGQIKYHQKKQPKLKWAKVRYFTKMYE